MGTAWSWGVLVGLPIAGVCVFAALLVIAFGVGLGLLDRRDQRGGGFLGGDGGVTAGVGVAFLVVTLVITGITMWPWDAEYHQWRPVRGVVSVIRSTASDATDQRFELRLQGSARELACEDSRCGPVVPGMYIELSCKRSWSDAGYDCVYVSAGTS